MPFILIAEQSSKNKFWLLTIRQPSFLSEGGRKLTDPPVFYLRQKFATKKEAHAYGRRILNRKGIKEEDIILENELFAAEELAKVLKVNIMTIYRHIKAKKIQAYKIGKEFRIDKDEFKKFLQKATVK